MCIHAVSVFSRAESCYCIDDGNNDEGDKDHGQQVRRLQVEDHCTPPRSLVSLLPFLFSGVPAHGSTYHWPSSEHRSAPQRRNVPFGTPQCTVTPKLEDPSLNSKNPLFCIPHPPIFTKKRGPGFPSPHGPDHIWSRGRSVPERPSLVYSLA